MDLKNIRCYVIISVLITTCHAFWWSPASSTEAPIKHIPLGYFRTYTYQPVGAASPLSFSILGTAANPFNWPSRVSSAPLLSGSKYELLSHPSSTEQPKPTPSPPPPTTTTTTTTTTTSTEPPPPPPPPLPTQPAQDRITIPIINSPNSINSASKYFEQTGGTFPHYFGGGGGMYNRRSLPYFQQPPNIFRPYPYPDYSIANQKANVQYVPCMCPISLGPQHDMAETRTIPDDEEMIIPKATDKPNENDNTVDMEEGEDEKKSLR